MKNGSNVIIVSYTYNHCAGTVESEIPLPSDGFYGLAVAVGRQRAIHTENSGVASPTLGTFPRFVVIGFYFLSETLI